MMIFFNAYFIYLNSLSLLCNADLGILQALLSNGYLKRSPLGLRATTHKMCIKFPYTYITAKYFDKPRTKLVPGV